MGSSATSKSRSFVLCANVTGFNTTGPPNAANLAFVYWVIPASWLVTIWGSLDFVGEYATHANVVLSSCLARDAIVQRSRVIIHDEIELHGHVRMRRGGFNCRGPVGNGGIAVRVLVKKDYDFCLRIGGSNRGFVVVRSPRMEYP